MEKKETEQEILNKVRKIEISTRKIVESLFSGSYHTRFKGQGMHFSDFREYYAGDDVRHIDWKVTARTQTAHIKKFEEERDLSIYLLADLSSSAHFGTAAKTKVDIIAEVCALIAFAAVLNNDKVGLILFTDEVEKHVPAKKGKSHALRLIRDILYYSTKSKKTSLKKALDFYYNVSKHSSVVFLVSDFLDNSDYETSLKKVARKHDLTSIRVRDIRENEIPMMGWLELYDPESGLFFSKDSGSYEFQKNFKKWNQEFETALQSLFLRSGVDTFELWTHDDYQKKLINYFKSRKRRNK